MRVSYWKAGMFLHWAEEALLAYIRPVFMHEHSIHYIADIGPQHSVKAGQSWTTAAASTWI